MSEKISIRIIDTGAAYSVSMEIGHQSFMLEHTDDFEDDTTRQDAKKAILWYANQLKTALEKTGATVEIQKESEDERTSQLMRISTSK